MKAVNTRWERVCITLSSVLVLASCTPEAEERIEKETEAHADETAGTAGVSMSQIYEALSTQPFEVPLPERHTLVRLTAVELKGRSVVEFIDPQLTDADADTGLVVMYVLASEQPVERFIQRWEQQNDGTMVELEGVRSPPASCSFSPGEASCVSLGAGYMLQISYRPEQATEPSEDVMRDLILAARSHLTRVVETL